MQEHRICAASACSDPIPPKPRPQRGGRPRIYCSKACQIRGNNARKGFGGLRAWPRSSELEAEVCRRYLSGLSLELLAADYGVAAETVVRVLKRNDVVRRSRNASTARKRTRSGRIRHNSGYIWVLLESDDPLLAIASSGKGWQNGYAQEHRVVMARKLGRPLRPNESVHHKNGIRDDNRPENLELWVKPQLAGQRVEDLVAFVVENYPEAVEAALAHRPQLRLVVEEAA